MANIKTQLDEWEVTDLEDNTRIRIRIEHNSKMGNNGVPGLQVWWGSGIVNYEPLHTARWAYAATKKQLSEFLLEDHSWIVYPDTYIKNSLILGTPLKARVEVKVRSSEKPVVKEYELPFTLAS